MGKFRSWRHARSKRTLGLAVGVVVASIIVISALASRGDSKKAASPPLEQPAAQQPARALPTLTASQQAAAVAIARSDSRVGPLLRNPGTTRTVVPWMTMSTHRLLGAGIDVSWPTPITVSGEWPALFYDQTEAEVPPYLTTTAEVRVSALTSVHLTIDLRNRRVLGVEALPDASVDSYTLPSGFHNTLPPQPDSD